MIAFLRGLLHETGEDQAIVDVGGVGYRVFASRVTLRDLPACGREVSLHIHTYVREDAFLLYAFATRTEKDMFLRLVEVTGVGPRLALAVLSVLPPLDLIRVVAAKDLKALTRVPGVGRKTAERLLLELRDKLTAAPAEEAATVAVAAAGGAVGDAVAALVALGYSENVAESAVQAVLAPGEDPVAAGNSDTSVLLRAALRRIAGA